MIQQLAFEWVPTVGYTQRWNARSASYRHTSEGGFNPRLYAVEVIPDDTTAKDFIEREHYSASYPAAKIRVGMWLEKTGQLVGVAVFSIPARAEVLTTVFPRLIPYVESLELGRFVLKNEVEANAESWFAARALRIAAASGVRGVVSFSDPVARTDMAGNTTFVGHWGTIYQASNAYYTGRGTPRTLTLLPDGRVFSDRTAQKIRAQEVGARYSEVKLVEHGAVPRRGDQDPATWLKESLAHIGARSLRHRGCHRYAFPIGPHKEKIEIKPPVLPYPKSGVFVLAQS